MILFVCFALLSLDCFKILLTAWVAEKPLLGTCQICFSAVYFILIFFLQFVFGMGLVYFSPPLFFNISDNQFHPTPLPFVSLGEGCQRCKRVTGQMGLFPAAWCWAGGAGHLWFLLIAQVGPLCELQQRTWTWCKCLQKFLSLCSAS